MLTEVWALLRWSQEKRLKHVMEEEMLEGNGGNGSAGKKTKTCKGGKVGNEQIKQPRAPEAKQVLCVFLKEKLSVSDLLEKT